MQLRSALTIPGKRGAQVGTSRPANRWTVAGPVIQFALIGTVAVVIVGLATAVASRRVGEREAITDARTKALVKAQGLIEPLVTDQLATGDPGAVAAIGEVVRRQVLDRDLVRVKIWTSRGLIVYSDEPRLIGSTYELGSDEKTALNQGQIEADVSNLSQPENRFERSQKKLLEVYLPIRTPSGERLLFEAYFKYDTVAAAGTRIWRSFAPISLSALVVLELLQIPLAWSLARRLRQRQNEQEALLRRALDASDVERRRIAGDLHDGVVQDLAGVAFALAGASRQPDITEHTARILDDSAGSVRSTVGALRSLLVEIYPPNLADEGLGSAISDLLAGAETRGLATSLDDGDLDRQLPEPVAALLYRATREALRNTVAHAGASSVQVRLGNDSAAAWVKVGDDGCGFSPEVWSDRVAEGHFGLKGLEGLVRDAGGRLEIESSPGAGTSVRVEVPLP